MNFPNIAIANTIYNGDWIRTIQLFDKRIRVTCHDGWFLEHEYQTAVIAEVTWGSVRDRAMQDKQVHINTILPANTPGDSNARQDR